MPPNGNRGTECAGVMKMNFITMAEHLKSRVVMCAELLSHSSPTTIMDILKRRSKHRSVTRPTSTDWLKRNMPEEPSLFPVGIWGKTFTENPLPKNLKTTIHLNR